MYKYDILQSSKGQFSLLISHNGELWSPPLNVSKKVSYLKSKMKSHRDEMVEEGYNEKAYYRIVDYDQNVVFEQCFQEEEKGEGRVPYHIETLKPKINYKEAYLYEYGGEIFTEEKVDLVPVTRFEVVCNNEGVVLTDLKLLRLIGNTIYQERFPIIVTKKAQVALATYLPLSKETFVKLPGCGEKMFAKCGERIIELIKKYLSDKD